MQNFCGCPLSDFYARVTVVATVVVVVSQIFANDFGQAQICWVLFQK